MIVKCPKCGNTYDTLADYDHSCVEYSKINDILKGKKYMCKFVHDDTIRREGAEKMLNIILKNHLDSGTSIAANVDKLWKEFENGTA